MGTKSSTSEQRSGTDSHNQRSNAYYTWVVVAIALVGGNWRRHDSTTYGGYRICRVVYESVRA